LLDCSNNSQVLPQKPVQLHRFLPLPVLHLLIVLNCLLLTSVSLSANYCQASDTSRAPVQLMWRKLQKTRTHGIVHFTLIVINLSNIIIVFVAAYVTNASSTSRYAITAFTTFHNP
jgi:hypothetical protein